MTTALTYIVIRTTIKVDTKIMKKKIKHLLISLLICGVLFSAGMNYSKAHSPIAVTLTYDPDTNDLTAHIFHTVGDPSTHYVYSVTITVNSILNASHIYTSQPDANEFDYIYSLNLTEGDSVSVTAICNQGGSKTGTLTFSLTSDDEPSDDEPSDDDTDDAPVDDGDDKTGIPGYTWVAVTVSLITLGMIYLHKSRSRQL